MASGAVSIIDRAVMARVAASCRTLVLSAKRRLRALEAAFPEAVDVAKAMLAVTGLARVKMGLVERLHRRGVLGETDTLALTAPLQVGSRKGAREKKRKTWSGGAARVAVRASPCTLHHACFTIHTSPCVLHHACFTMHTSPCVLRPIAAASESLPEPFSTRTT